MALNAKRVAERVSVQPNKRVQSDAAAAAGYQGEIGYVAYFELKGTSENTRRG